VQVQPWRATWLLAVFAAAGLGLCSVGLWKRGAVGRVRLAFLVLAWIVMHVPIAALGAAGLALALTALPVRPELDLRRVALVIWGVVASCALLFFGMRLYALALLLAGIPVGARGVLAWIRDFNLLAVPLCLLAVLWANAKDTTRTMAITATASLVLVVSAFLLWDSRPAWETATDRFAPDPDLERLLAARPGEILWIGGGFAVWSQAGRPSWVSRLQGASNVFSRELALIWDERTRLLTALDLVDARLRTPFHVRERMSNEEPHLANLSDARLERLCALSDAPAWVIVPVQAMAAAPVSLERWKPRYWKAPAPAHAFHWAGETVKWTTTQDYAVIPCTP